MIPPLVASVVYAILIAGLFALNWGREGGTSKLLWLPVLWLLIAGSRPVSVWLNNAPSISADQMAEGSPFDRAVYLGLLVAGIAALCTRPKAVGRFLRANGILLLFVFYCAVSVTWSDYPDVAFKRWIKSLGDYVMVLIVMTDSNQLAAIKRVVARVSFLLIPLSILLIKYYPSLGRGYSPWDGTAYYSGVATDKNMLGMLCLVAGLGLVWCFTQELQAPKGSRRTKSLIAYGTVLAMVAWLFSMANSMTSLSCFLMGTILILVTSLRRTARKTWLVHVLVASMLAVIITALFLDLGSGLVQKLGRDPTLTGRTQLWAQILKMTQNPLLGTGFESFWLGTRLDTLARAYWWHPTESHNGYIETYLNLGWIGVVLLGMVLITSYRNVIRQVKRGLPAGRLCLALFFIGLAYNFTEAAIRTTDLVWLAFLFSVVRVPQVSPAGEHALSQAESLLPVPQPGRATSPAGTPLQPIAKAGNTPPAARERVALTGNRS